MAENRTITMSIEEINRSIILKMADEKKITQKADASRIEVSEQHFR